MHSTARETTFITAPIRSCVASERGSKGAKGLVTSIALAGLLALSAAPQAFAAVLPDPGTMEEFSADACTVYEFRVTGSDDEDVWGTDV